jgi:titin
LTVSITGLNNGQSHSFYVAARNLAGVGVQSGVVTSTPCTIPEAPSLNSAVAGSSLATLQWIVPASDGGSPITGYKVFYGPSAPSIQFGDAISASTFSFDVIGLTPGSLYHFAVVALNSAGESTLSNERTATPYTISNPPVLVSAIDGDLMVSLVWTAPNYDGSTAILGYKVFYGLVSPNMQFGEMLSADSLSADVTSLTAGNLYHFAIRAVNLAGDSILSNQKTAIPYTNPDAPILNIVTPSAGAVDLTWSAPSTGDVHGYKVFYGTSSTPATQFSGTLGPETTSTSVTGLANGVRYYFGIKAVNLAGDSPLSNVLSATPYTVPDAPNAPTATAGNGLVSLTWSTPSFNGGREITGYQVYYGLSTPNMQFGSTFTATTRAVDVTGLTPGSLYHFAVKAVNIAGDSAPSAERTVIPYTVPNAPTLNSAIVGSAQVTLTWTAPSTTGFTPLTGYQVFYGTTSTPTTQFGGTYGASTLGMTVTGLTPGQLYYFAIKAVNAAGDSANSNVLSAIEITYPGAPSISNVTVATSQATLVWTSPTNGGGSPIIRYNVYRSNSENGTYAIVSSPTGLSYLNTGLVNGQTYYYRVSALNAFGEGILCPPVSATPMTEYDYRLTNGHTQVEITGYHGAGGYVIIPASIDGRPVTSIASHTFEYCTSIITVTIPGSVVSIGNRALSSCTSMVAIIVDDGNPAYTSLDGALYNKDMTELIQYPGGKAGPFTIPSSVTKIGPWAFAYCPYLTIVDASSPPAPARDGIYVCDAPQSLSAPTSGLTCIGDGAFAYCTALVSVAIPDSVISIGTGVFTACTSLTEIEVNTNNVIFISVDGVLYRKDMTEIIQCPGGKTGVFTVPDSVTSVGPNVFTSCTSLTAFVVGTGNLNYASVNGALYNKALTELIQYPAGRAGAFIVPSTVAMIDADAFAYCALLTAIDVNAANTHYTSVNGVLYDKGIATLVQYPGGKVGTYILPSTVTSIEANAFAYCSLLTAIYVNAGNQHYASLDGVLYDKIISTLVQYPGGRSGAATIPSSVLVIKDGAFNSCSLLTELYFNGNAPAVGEDWINNHDPALAICFFNGSVGFSTPTWFGVATVSMTPSSAPQNLVAEAGYAQASLVWEAPASTGGTPITGYDVYYGTNATPSTLFASYGAGVISAVVTDLTPGTLYYFDVKAMNLAGESDISNVEVATPYTVPDAPILIGVITGHDSIIFTWAAPTSDGGSPITNYQLYWDTANPPVANHVAYGPLVFSIELTGLTAGTTYYMTATAINAAGESIKPTSLSVIPYTISAAPALSSVTGGILQASLVWIAPMNTGSTPITGYKVFYGTTSTPGTLFATVSNVTLTTNVTGLLPGTLYYFAVEAVNAAGDSTLSNVISSTPYTIPSAPTLESVTAGVALVKLAWTAPASNGGALLTGYLIYFGTASPNLQFGEIIPSTRLMVNVTGLADGTTYYFAVKAVNRAGNSSNSNILNATVMTVPGAPTGLTATSGVGKVTLNWLAPTATGGSAITAYKVYRSLVGAEENIANVSGSTLSYVDGTATVGTNYTYFVKAVNDVGTGANSVQASATAQATSNTNNTMLYAGIAIVAIAIVAIAVVLMRRKE